MGVLRQAWTETVLLHRALSLWLLGVLGAWLLWLGWQEAGMTSIRAPLFWPGVEAALLVVVAMLPPLWQMSRRRVAADWILRNSARPAGTVVAQWLAVAGYGGALTMVVGGLAFTLGRMWGVRLHAEPLAVLAGEVVVFGMPTAALAPALGALRLPPSWLLVAWAGGVGLSVWQGFPLPTRGILMLQDWSAPPIGTVRVLAASAMATAAGLALSLALVIKSR